MLCRRFDRPSDNRRLTAVHILNKNHFTVTYFTIKSAITVKKEVTE